MRLWICVCLYFLFGEVRTQISDGEPCYTSKNEYGICVSIKNCPVMIQLLRTRSGDPDTVTYLRTSTCGYVGTLPMVCCPEDTNDVNSNENNGGHNTHENKDGVEGNTRSNNNGNGKEKFTINSERCGISNVTNYRVVGGIPAKLHEIPFIVNLGYKNPRNANDPKWLCAGSLITDKHILTAGHCVHNRKDLYIARFGDLDLSSNADGADPEDIKLVSAKVHENYSPTKFTSDIAILTLERAPKHPWVWPVCLPKDEPLRSTTFVKWSAIVAGWGALYFNGPSSPTLQIAQIPVVDPEKCKTAFGNKAIIDERILCAGRADGRQDACQGDSGGPLIWGQYDGENIRYFQIGVVSYGFRCAEKGYPGVYTRVTNFIDWIQDNVK